MFSVFVLLVAFCLVWGAMKLHRARHEVTEQAHHQAFSSATAGRLGRLTGRVGSLLRGGGVTRSHPTIVRPRLGRYRRSRGFPALSVLPNEAYIGTSSERVQLFTGEEGRWVTGRARYSQAIATGPPWTLSGPEGRKCKRFYTALIRFGVGDVHRPLKLARDPITRR